MVFVVLVIAYVLYNIMRQCGTYSVFFGSYSPVGFGWRKRSDFDSATRSMALMRAADIRADGVVRGCRSQRMQESEVAGGRGGRGQRRPKSMVAGRQWLLKPRDNQSKEGQHGASRWPEGEVRSAGITQG